MKKGQDGDGRTFLLGFIKNVPSFFDASSKCQYDYGLKRMEDEEARCNLKMLSVDNIPLPSPNQNLCTCPLFALHAKACPVKEWFGIKKQLN